MSEARQHLMSAGLSNLTLTNMPMITALQTHFQDPAWDSHLLGLPAPSWLCSCWPYLFIPDSGKKPLLERPPIASTCKMAQPWSSCPFRFPPEQPLPRVTPSLIPRGPFTSPTQLQPPESQTSFQSCSLPLTPGPSTVPDRAAVKQPYLV